MTSTLHRTRAERWDWGAARGVCLREAQRILGTSASAEDAAQEAVIRAWRQRGACHAPERPDPWIVTIARREALRIAARSGDQRELSEPPGGGDHTDEAIVGLTVRQALATLDREERRLLYARYWRDLPQEEIARRLGMPAGTVKIRLHRLRHRLRQLLEE
jgi:RNA polymerase sigma-70 factor (ECF subfamily)